RRVLFRSDAGVRVDHHEVRRRPGDLPAGVPRGGPPGHPHRQRQPRVPRRRLPQEADPLAGRRRHPAGRSPPALGGPPAVLRLGAAPPGGGGAQLLAADHLLRPRRAAARAAQRRRRRRLRPPSPGGDRVRVADRRPDRCPGGGGALMAARTSLKLRMAAVVAVAALALLVLLVTGAITSARVEDHLASIRGNHLPRIGLQPRLEGHFERIGRGLQDAVAASDVDMLADTRQLADRFTGELAAAGDAVDPQAAAALRQAVADYYGAAYRVSERLIAGETG